MPFVFKMFPDFAGVWQLLSFITQMFAFCGLKCLSIFMKINLAGK